MNQTSRAARTACVAPRAAYLAPRTGHAARRRALCTPPLALVVLLVAACHAGPPGPLEGRAADQWTRSYPIADGGEVQLVGANGAIDVHSGSGRTVDVVAERVAHAMDEKSAKEILPRIQIREDVSPDKIVITTEGLGGIVIGVETEVSYKLTVPPGVRLRLRTANGAITVADFDGRIVASSANGPIAVRNLKGGVEARTTNGNIEVDLARFGDEPVDLRTSNGKIDLTLSNEIAASLLANVTNGAVDISDLPFEPTGEQTRRRVRGRLNGGGLPIELNTVNGSIHIHPRP